MEITYKFDIVPETDAIIDLYRSAEINRPLSDHKRIGKMYVHSNLVVTAWHNEKLVGISRSLTDFCYSCYLSDLAVRQEYKHMGIGKKLIGLTKEKTGDHCMLLLLSSPSAMNYYPKVGFEEVENGFIIRRLK